MKNAKTISWILLATGLASRAVPAGFDAISMIADGIQRAIPTDKELHGSVKWLLENGLVISDNNKYSLTENGKRMINNAEAKNDNAFKMCKYLEREIANLV
jgi:hypothetical protein